MSAQSYRTLAPADVGAVEAVVCHRATAILRTLDGPVDPHTLADCVLGTLGAVADDAEAVAMLERLEPMDRLDVVLRIVTDHVAIPVAQGGAA